MQNNGRRKCFHNMLSPAPPKVVKGLWKERVCWFERDGQGAAVHNQGHSFSWPEVNRNTFADSRYLLEVVVVVFPSLSYR